MRKTFAAIGLTAALATTGGLAAFRGSATASEENPYPQGRGTKASAAAEAASASSSATAAVGSTCGAGS